MISNLERVELPEFNLGRITTQNHASVPKNALLIAKNLLLNNGALLTVPGYRAIQTLNLKKIQRMYPYERQTDKKLFFVVTGTNNTGKASIILAPINGKDFAPIVLSTTEDNGDFEFVQTVYALYMGNGKAAYKLINVNGVETLIPWGLLPPASAPSLDFGTGTLSLTLGRRYVYCEVYQWIDSLGVTRYHIGPPSDFSAHTGVLASKAVTVGSLVKANPHATHFWIFATPNSAIDASGSYYFAAQVDSSVSEWIDTLTDDQLDTTRQAPFRNIAPPLSNIILEYNSRPILMFDDTIQIGALDEIDLGDPFSCFPSILRFKVPGGIKKLTAGAVFNQVLLAATEDFWFAVNGNSLATFSKKDRVAVPGAVSRKSTRVIHGHLSWLNRDKKLWTWTGIEGDDPVPASEGIHQDGEDALSMNDLSTAYLEQCELQWYSNGTYDFAVLACPSVNTSIGEFDWVQIWDLSPVVGVKTIQGPLPQPALTDMFPVNNFSATVLAKDGGIPYIYFGDIANGTIYRWPDGEDFNGAAIDAAMGTPWVQAGEMRSKNIYAKLFTDTIDAKSKFKILAVASNGVSETAHPVEIEMNEVRDGDLSDPSIAYGDLRAEGASWGNWIKIFVIFPSDKQAHTLERIEIGVAPVKGR